MTAIAFPTIKTAVPLDLQVRSLLDRSAELWWTLDSTLPDLGPLVTPRQQQDNERRVSALTDRLVSQLKRASSDPAAREAARAQLLDEGFECAQALFGFDSRQIDVIRRSGLLEAAETFARMARAYDPAIRGEDIFQASRNVMTMNFMQLLLGFPVEVTPCVFAYSMLYPYTDNYLDDPQVSSETKAGFNRRFYKRLAGQDAVPVGSREERIFALVGQVEDQFPRRRHLAVYDSLLAIHAAQGKSLRQLRPGASPYELDILRLSFEKGGTSVLADGFLVAGGLEPREAEFMFAYGAFTQLMDDLEDVETDRQAGFQTIFSQTAGHWPLDSLTNRAIHLGARTFDAMDQFPVPSARPLREVIQRALPVLLSISAAGAAQYYTRPYLRELEAHMPVRFRFLRDQRRKLDRSRVSLTSWLGL